MAVFQISYSIINYYANKSAKHNNVSFLENDILCRNVVSALKKESPAVIDSRLVNSVSISLIISFEMLDFGTCVYIHRLDVYLMIYYWRGWRGGVVGKCECW